MFLQDHVNVMHDIMLNFFFFFLKGGPMLVEPHYPQSHQQFHTVDNITNKGKKRKFVLSFQLSIM